jgi:hypothetical protein
MRSFRLALPRRPRHVRFTAIASELWHRSESTLSADIVAKVTEQMLWNSNLKQSNRGECAFESTLSACARF